VITGLGGVVLLHLGLGLVLLVWVLLFYAYHFAVNKDFNFSALRTTKMFTIILEMHDWLLYFMFFLMLTSFSAIIYIRIKYPFWSFIDANHSYDWFLRKSGYSISRIPSRNKFVVRNQVTTNEPRSFDECAILLQKYYIPSDKILYECEAKHIEARITGHIAQMSFYTPPHISTKENNNEPSGVMISYLVNVRDDMFPSLSTANYISHIVSSESSTTQKLIATHIYNVHDKTPDKSAFIVKKTLVDARVYGLSYYLAHPCFTWIQNTNPNWQKTHRWSKYTRTIGTQCWMRLTVFVDLCCPWILAQFRRV